MTDNIVDRVDGKSNCSPESFSAKQLLKGSSVIIYGAGEGYYAVKRTILVPFNLVPQLIIDNKFPSLVEFDKIPATNLSNLRELSNNYLGSDVIVTLGNKNIYRQVRLELHNMGYQNVLWAPDLYEYSIHHYDKGFLDAGAAYFHVRSKAIDDAYRALADEESRQLFEELLKRYMTGEPVEIPSDSFEHQYLPQDVPLSAGVTDYLCCGAYDGDSIRKICAAHGRIKKVVAFEPDPINYKKLTTYLKENSEDIAETICAIPCGVYSESRQLRFCGNSGLSSAISESGDQVVSVLSIDDVFAGTKFTYITMDVEGAEYTALQGARDMIKRHVPDLAISVYHAPEDLWRILNYLDSLRCGYKFYLRNYSGFTYETLLYATKVTDQ